MNDIKVSVICLAYNHEKYIESAIKGFLMQKTNFKFEVIIQDDASTDNTAKIVEKYAKEYPDLITAVLQKTNQYQKGVKLSKSVAKAYAQGEFIAFCEGDDYWTDENKLQMQYDIMKSNSEISLCCHAFSCLDVSYMKMTDKVFDFDKNPIDTEYILKNGCGKVQTATYFIRKEIFLDFPKWREAFPVGDFPSLLMASLRGKIHYIPKVMSVYRFGTASSWSKNIMANKEKSIASSNQTISALKLFDEYTDYKYTELVNNRIRFQKFNINFKQKNYKAVKTEYKDFYKNLPKRIRFEYFLSCKLPPIYTLTQKMKNLLKKCLRKTRNKK